VSEPAAERAAKEARQVGRVLRDSERPFDADQEDPLAPDIPPDRTRQFRSVNFSRMRTTWSDDDRIKIEEIRRLADEAVFRTFYDAYELLDRIRMAVREPQCTDDGEVLRDKRGRPLWQLNERGVPAEDWTKMTDRQRLMFLYEIVTHLFEWTQRSEAVWMDAMFAKGLWEEAFAFGFSAQRDKRLTIDDRTQFGHIASMEQRYFAIFQSALSRRAQAMVRSLGLLEQRLKDTAQL
jgi:hypothetical protein